MAPDERRHRLGEAASAARTRDEELLSVGPGFAPLAETDPERLERIVCTIVAAYRRQQDLDGDLL